MSMRETGEERREKKGMGGEGSGGKKHREREA